MQFEWIGSNEPLLDRISYQTIGNVHIGCFGGSTSGGATKNEDAIFLMQGYEEEWVFSVLIDAHNSSESAQIIIELFKSKKERLREVCSSQTVFRDIEPYIIQLFEEDEFRNKCTALTGEASCLICFQSGGYLWWLSIGDCMAFLFHPELAKFNQYSLNQRQFFEWIGQVNTFDLPVPCYSAGRRQLRGGTNIIMLSTDGIYEYEKGYYQSTQNLYKKFTNDNQINKNFEILLVELMNDQVRDSTSMICWTVNNKLQVQYPSD